MRENTTAATLWGLSGGVISIPLTRRPQDRASCSSRVPAESLAQERPDFRGWGPAKCILFHVYTNPSRVGPGRVPRVTRGRVRPPRRARREPAGGPVAASFADERRLRDGPGRSGSPLGPPCDFETGAPDRSLETVTPPASSRGRQR